MQNDLTGALTAYNTSLFNMYADGLTKMYEANKNLVTAFTKSMGLGSFLETTSKGK
jgi:ribosomal protein S17E